MILKYVLTGFGRRKVRTILMILSLIVSTGLIVTMSATVETIRRSNVDLIASETGRFDLAVSKKDTSSLPFISIEAVSGQILTADELITAVYPRLEAEVEMTAGERQGKGMMIALLPDVEDVGFIDVLEGEYLLGADEAAVLEETARTLNLEVGDVFEVAYSYPLPREEGKQAAAGTSSRRTTRPFTVKAIVREDGVAEGGVRSGFIANLAEIQKWLDAPGQASKLIATVNPALYDSNNAEAAALRVREVGQNVYRALGDEYGYAMAKAQALSGTAQAFLAIQALINTYGLISLGVVGLLIYTLMLTNVQEQRRDMAILRILGAQRSYLFAMVIAEVIVIGVIGVGLGIVLGQLITQFIVVPLIQQQFATQGITTPLVPQMSLSAILPPAAAAFFVLIVASIKPAREAANTKVIHAINPGVADNIQIEDLAQLRERNPSLRMFLGGLALMLIFALIASFEALETFGGPAIQVTMILLAMGLLVLGLGLMFFIATVPLERLVMAIIGLFSPRLTYFASRNVKRGQTRNTLISMLVLFSGVLPSFLATQMALENANFESAIRQMMGAEADIKIATFGRPPEEMSDQWFRPSFLSEELAAIPGIEQSAGLTFDYESGISDPLNFKRARVTVKGVEGRLEDVIFMDLVQFAEGGPGALGALHGIGIARRIPRIDGIGRSRLEAQNGSTVLISREGFRRLRTELNSVLPPDDERVLENVKAVVAPGADVEEVSRLAVETFREEYDFWISFLEIRLEQNERSQASQQIFLVVLTLISFTTAVFGVFAVIYVTIYSRRIEIGMMKALGMKQRQLTGMLIIEAIVMTLGAALAGVVAGAAMGYATYYGQSLLAQEHVNFAVDTTVIPLIVIMVVLASVLGAGFSAWRIVKKRAVEILRM